MGRQRFTGAERAGETTAVGEEPPAEARARRAKRPACHAPLRLFGCARATEQTATVRVARRMPRIRRAARRGATGARGGVRA